MKKYKIINYVLLIAALAISNGCSDLLEENPRSDVTPLSFATQQGLLAGIAGVYNNMRSAWGTEGFTIQQMAGTDEYMEGSGVSTYRQIFTYNGITGSNFSGGFNFYADINALNGILELGPTAPGIDAITLQAYLGQAQFLRAFLYFYLVQTYGNIPLSTSFITKPSQAAVPAPPSEVYAVIVKDLTDAIENLPDTPTTPFLGKAATVGAAKWLLAKVYLTRGWLNNDNADFTLAYNTAKGLIDTKDTYGLGLWQNYSDAFKPENDYGKETIFVSDHTNDPKYGYYTPGAGQSGGAALNVTPWMGLFNGPSTPGANSTADGNGNLTSAGDAMLTRDVQYGRPYSRIRPNMKRLAGGPNTGKSYLLDQAFADRQIDSRYHKTFQTVWLANKKPGDPGQIVMGTYSGPGIVSSRGTLMCGLDTAIWFSDYEVPGAPQNFGARPFKGIIVTPNMQNPSIFPYMKKLADPRRVNHNDPSYRPVVIARFSDVYLIAAEAAFKLGQIANAVEMLNEVRKRAAYRAGTPYTPGGAHGTSTPATIVGDPYPAVAPNQAAAEAALTATTAADLATRGIDYILDERTREFYGESVRWHDLVRTKSLVTRVQAWNSEAGANVQVHHMLRPIPQDQIDLVSIGPKYPQNPEY